MFISGEKVPQDAQVSRKNFMLLTIFNLNEDSKTFFVDICRLIKMNWAGSISMLLNSKKKSRRNVTTSVRMSNIGQSIKQVTEIKHSESDVIVPCLRYQGVHALVNSC